MHHSQNPYNALMKRVILAGALALALLRASAPSASAATPPATLSQVEALVAASTSITSIPAALSPPVSAIGNDVPGAVLPGAGSCVSASRPCVFGLKTAKSTIVLLGDSHALMWSPAVDLAARARKVRLLFMWLPSCPQVATPLGSPCTKWKNSAYAEVKKVHPLAVVLAERTTGNESSDTDAQWASSLEYLFKYLTTLTSKVIMIGDTPELPMDPGPCLARFATSVQTCAGSTVTPSGAATTHAPAEATASSAVRRVSFIDPTPWLCATTCSPIIGTMVAYYDRSHLSGSYAAFLGGVMTHALSVPLFGR